MSSKRDDFQIRKLFEALRRSDEEVCPSFAEVLDSSEVSQRRGAIEWVLVHRKVVITFAFIVFCLGPLAWLYRTNETGEEYLDGLELYEWESPTGFMLGYAEDTIMEQTPSLGYEIPEWVTGSSTDEQEM